MKLIVGLGNPGKEYKNNRHNAGFILIDLLAEKLGLSWKFERKFNAEICKNEKFVLVKPQTFMNDSGLSVSKAIKFFKIDLDNLVVVHDDVDLPFGEFKYKKGSGTAGHHGVADIAEKVGSLDFWRFRIGVGRPGNNKFDVYGYVLGDFSDEEFSILENNIFKVLTQKV
ncbi:aminoacyl-tRNA hydrolase [candidate division WWE3 bacterium RIFCSPHIGHO2_12_FULL_38_15]|uniref:Peptidyl-tRNA hydrolase n=1 Tax=candidate division WWE3 bacterium RIFCSPHIGHO2_02_FULL_38_14 TaxID=1802620 RepID=A0A1F4V745_UNCKA|nr:MAG: aminoacyl-tRNA hydrolase [candidate division WWE3 bacterium RIFCSPHIGHO2_01_FULL_38_45]OGC48882.1 MAG: aminoacyl-tRNA hydrolase [candidate division WWE3 bacterium RIFCSPHIGHO2_12_FULL_38_15]OGC53028.1 MAG: aminoacyl-tRNA hydrolase [candidate division WWE3 bacterium RIFCSPHIGHO2_02_FULL_38_14]OGC53185.1 MAG: aminoacyl-tRNA hydrolase [candidate division WWE3 bacterium RIFCSPLOWO2_01_FULL_37_24]HLB52030.1 aminoacyl-tRNA hydrolase [Patescibacteria group bacterium]